MELRERSALSSILLYVLSSSFIVFTIWKVLPAKEWGMTFWVIYLFAALMAVLRTFGKESTDRYYYFYTLYHPNQLFIGKALFNCILLLILFFLLWGALGLMAGNPVHRVGWFLICGLIASIGFSVLMTFISSISIRTRNHATLSSVLSLPLLLPLLINLLRLSSYSLGETTDENPWNEMVLIGSVLSLVLAMSLWLFPYLWRAS